MNQLERQYNQFDAKLWHIHSFIKNYFSFGAKTIQLIENKKKHRAFHRFGQAKFPNAMAVWF